MYWYQWYGCLVFCVVLGWSYFSFVNVSQVIGWDTSWVLCTSQKRSPWKIVSEMTDNVSCGTLTPLNLTTVSHSQSTRTVLLIGDACCHVVLNRRLMKSWLLLSITLLNPCRLSISQKCVRSCCRGCWSIRTSVIHTDRRRVSRMYSSVHTN